MIAGTPTADAIGGAWSDYSEAVRISMEMAGTAATSQARAAQALRAHRLHRRFTLMSDLAEVSAVLEPNIRLVEPRQMGSTS